jgi:cellulose synthase/poly-beta-1,6-N-acetylglucosamine synthase-like glycosyltransferase
LVGGMSDLAATLVLALTTGVFAFLIPFASHRSYLLIQARRGREEDREPCSEEDLPLVTVQLPMYNERAVAERVIDAVCGLDYPTALLEVQVLDDSDDVTSWLVEQRVAHWQARGVRIDHIRRSSRDGFKAGALAHGVAKAKGEFLLVLDADFVPGPDLVRQLLPPMKDASVGMVQARWDHLNSDRNWLTEAQSFLLDGHFLYEQGGRYAGGRFFNFNGTAGLWRRDALESSGGWRADTLTEDLDLSYRAQMAGWRFAYLDDVVVPAEIPETVMALEVQQRRWAQGGIQTGRKILPELLRGDYPVGVKVEATIHLLGHLAHPLTWMLALLLFPSAVARRGLGLDHLLWLDLILFSAATVPFMIFYWTAGGTRGRPRRGRAGAVLRTLALGIGLSVPVSRAVLRGLRSCEDPFVRTPKQGEEERRAYPALSMPFDTIAKIGMVLVMTAYLVLALAGGYWGQLPFILLFLSGYLGLGLPGLLESVGVGAELPARGVEDQEAQEGDPHSDARRDGLDPRSTVLIPTQSEVADECEAA